MSALKTGLPTPRLATLLNPDFRHSTPTPRSTSDSVGSVGSSDIGVGTPSSVYFAITHFDETVLLSVNIGWLVYYYANCTLNMQGCCGGLFSYFTRYRTDSGLLK